MKFRTESGHTAIWWEKTVEYAYLAKSVSDGVQLVPFAGPLERATGDAIEIVGNEFVIIEFKDLFSKKAIRQESIKFLNEYRPYYKYRAIITEFISNYDISAQDTPHYFAHREVINNGKINYVSDSFDIEYRDYWTFAVVEYPKRWLATDFLVYLRCLNAMRTASSQGEIPSGAVYGFSSDGCIVSVCALEDVLKVLRSTKTLKFTDSEELVQKHQNESSHGP
ncbi:hypothetical protein [Mycoplana dimorpha]|uniref:hypothetical protein n=1 Tax=Mycoplana dimorpha TaxID=28320 RepID=UPI0011B239A4|nr:hypothetical protein [Mycoplana dimorpha]